MEAQAPMDFQVNVLADPASVRELVRAVLHAIFFHRFFLAVRPRTREVLGVTVPWLSEDAELETLIDGRAAQAAADAGGGRAPAVVVSLFERKRRRASAWLGRGPGADTEVCWERWAVRLTLATPRSDGERAKLRRAIEDTLLRALADIVTCVNAHKDHIPIITTQDSNPFPYKIAVLSDRSHPDHPQHQQVPSGWASRLGYR